ncbi:hypothetical protein RUM43_003937 [Polyplax serrata]|uniref:Uncharacterized protein n=1 Tax=Polyplax serrata TaxID=468196 RepID=A0AAN8S8E9_POLSC
MGALAVGKVKCFVEDWLKKNISGMAKRITFWSRDTLTLVPSRPQGTTCINKLCIEEEEEEEEEEDEGKH